MSLCVNLIILYVVAHYVMRFGVILSLITAYICSLIITMLPVMNPPDKPHIIMYPYLAIEYVLSQIPFLKEIIYCIGIILLIPFILLFKNS